MGRAIALALVAVGVALLVYWLAAPKPAPVPAIRSNPSPAVAPADPPSAHAPTDTSAPIDPPKSSAQREYESRESRRNALYARIRQEGGAYLTDATPDPDDPATLDLYTAQDNDALVDSFLNLIVRLDAYHYGFRHVRFFLPNPSGTAERFRMAAEAQPDASGAWQAFRK